MKIWKASFAVALLALPLPLRAFADTAISLTPGTPPPAYGSYNPANPAYGAMIPGGVQQYYNSIMSQAGTMQQGQQQQQPVPVNGAYPGQPPVQVQYHYKNPNKNLGSIPDEELPQRLFHNIPPHYYGSLSAK